MSTVKLFTVIYLSNKILGQFKNNQANGFCLIYKNQEEIIYQGELKNDKKHGYGIDSTEGTINYKGQFENDERNGLGSIVYYGEAFYLGEWKNNLYNGFVNLI